MNGQRSACRWLGLSAGVLLLAAAPARAPSRLARQTADEGAEVTVAPELAASLGLPQQSRKAKALWLLPSENPDRAFKEVSVLLSAGGGLTDMIWESQRTISADSTPKIEGTAVRVSMGGVFLNAASISGSPGQLEDKPLPSGAPAAEQAFARARRFWLEEADWSRLHNQ